MIYTIKGRYLAEPEGVHAFQARDVKSKLARIRPPLVMRIDPACGAKIVFSRFGIELVKCKLIDAFKYSKVLECNSGNNCTAHTAK